MSFRVSVSPSGSGGRAGRAVFGLVFAGAAAAMLCLFVRDARRADAILGSWVRTPCTVVSSQVREGPNGAWLFSARYRFHFDGREVEGANVLPGRAELSFDRIARRAKLLADHPAGGDATCLVNPLDPSDSALLPPETVVLPAAAIVCSVFVVAGLLLAFVPSRRSRDEGPERVRPGAARRGQLAFGIAFAAVGALFASFGAAGFARTLEARSWTPVEATVLRSEVVRATSRSSKGGSSTTYRPYVAYAYEFGGERREGDRYAAATVSSGDPEPARRAVAEHPAGSRTTVWVDPDDPSRSVVADPHARPPAVLWVFLLFPLVFVVVGLALAVGAARDRRAAGAPLPPGPPVLRDDRRGQFLKGIVFAVFWNGFVAAFFLLARSAGGRVDPILIVFLGVFGLVGLVILGAALRAGAKIFAPRLELACGRGCLLRGGETLVVYRLLGGTPGDVVGAKIELVAQRFETVRQGRNTYRKPVELFRETVFETDSFRALSRGDLRVALPDGAPRSSRGAEPVRWHFAVELARPARKPLRDDYEVVVR